MENKSHTKKRNFTLVLFENGSNFQKKVERLETKSIRRFLTRLRLLKSPLECYLRVHYPNGNYNDGYYSGEYGNKKYVLKVFKAFCESKYGE